MLAEGSPLRHLAPSTLRPRACAISAMYQSPTTPSKEGDGAPTASSSNLTVVSPRRGSDGGGRASTAEAIAVAPVADGAPSVALASGDAGDGGGAVGRSQPTTVASPKSA